MRTTFTHFSYSLRIILLSIFFAFGLFYRVHATHIRAGEITAEKTDNLTNTYLITFTGFRDTGSQIEFGGGYFNFGDGTTEEGPFVITKTEYDDSETEMVQFSVTHTYQGNATYVISYQEDYRNANIINMDNSVNTTFYVETMIVIDPFFGLNNTPVTTVPPIDEAAVGVMFIHNAGAYDPDGDSISYQFVVPKQGRDREVSNYRDLNDAEFYSSYDQGNEAQNSTPTLTLDEITGDLVWDAPGDVLNQGDRAEYNVAFVIEEWRYIPAAGEWYQLGYVTRDMQIIVEETDNNRPTLIVPDALCVEAGTLINETIEGDDPDGDPVKLEAYGGPFEINSPATYSPDPAEFQGPPAYLEFEWQTVCGHVRERAYEVQFKVTDDPDTGPSLVDFESFDITVVGPPPTGLTTTLQTGKSIQLNWDDYSCSGADYMEIWRRVGSYDIDATDCNVGMPAGAGYTLIDTISIDITEYLDTNDDEGLNAGANYCYRLVAVWDLPGGGESYVSAEACDSIIADVPVITNVDVTNTGESDGEIFVKWTPPYQIDSTLFPPDYTYDVLRAEGLVPNSTQSGGQYEVIVAGISDTTFTDTGLNTMDLAYNYIIRLYDGLDVLVDSSASASSVLLDLNPLLSSIELEWDAEVPWSNLTQDYPYHYIYRDQILDEDLSQLVLIDSVDVTVSGFYYKDNGDYLGEELDDEIEYCYYVTAQGSYDNTLFPEPLINRSQVACGQPNDTIPPCSPSSSSLGFVDELTCEEIIASYPCGTTVFSNTISWEAEDEDSDCGDDVVYYNVYFSETGNEEDYSVVATPATTQFSHTGLSSLKGCYRISAVDRSGNESDLTDPICMDNCPVFKMPNAFSPNGDNTNEWFGPMTNEELNISGFDLSNCMRFVSSLTFKVFDRSGDELYTYDSEENENGIYIKWDGTNKGGEELPAGTYYYVVDVVFDVLESSDAKKTYKGWVQLLK